MIEIFFAICAFTTLECADITVAYYDGLEQGTHAAAGYDADGNYYILVHPDNANKDEAFIHQLMVHEIAHLITFDIDPTYNRHYGLYEEVCEDLKQLTRVSGRYVCEPYSDPPHYPWVGRG